MVEEIWRISGEQGATWIQANIDIPPPKARLASGTYQLVFSAEISGAIGKFAIDDLALVEGTCSQVCERYMTNFN